MNKLMNAAIIGVFALALQTNAHAATVQLVDNAAAMMSETRISQDFLGELGLTKGATQKQLVDAIGNIKDAKQQAAVAQWINAYAKSAKASNGNKEIAKNNEQLALLAFKDSSGNMLKVASMVTDSNSRENITSAQGSTAGQCDIRSYAQRIADKTAALGVSEADAESVLADKLVQQGKCGTQDGMLEMGAEAEANVIKIGKYEQAHCMVGGQAPHGQVRDNCIEDAMVELGISADKAAAAQNLAHLDSEGSCQFFPR